MKCKRCGAEFDEGIFCPECGTKYDEEEAKHIEAEQLESEERKQEEKLCKEILEKEAEEERKLELEKAKVEQERLAVEKAAHEVELVRQQNEKARIEQERRYQEELKRTFNGVLYNTIDEMNVAKAAYDEQVALAKKTKSVNVMAILSFVLALATYPLVMTIVLWILSFVLSIIFGVKAIIEKTNKKGFVIAGFIIDGLFVLIIILSIILALNS